MEYLYKDKQLPTKEEKAAKKEQARLDAEQNLTARKKVEDAFRSNSSGQRQSALHEKTNHDVAALPHSWPTCARNT